MRFRPRWILTLVALLASFAGGAVFSPVGYAKSESSSPYAVLAQMARVLVLVEHNHVDPVSRQALIDGAIKGMVAALDPHSAYMTPDEFSAFNEDTEGTFGGIGVEVDFRDDAITVIAPIEGSPAERAGIHAGDVIIAVAGKVLQSMPVDKIVGLMRGLPGSKVRLTIRRKGHSEPLDFELTREHIHVRSIDYKALAGGVGYLRLKQFQSGTHDELLGAVAALRKSTHDELNAILLDLRSNPGGLIDEAEAVADEFLTRGTIYTTRHRGRVLDDVEAHRGGVLTRQPVVVLVDEYSASSAELLAGALQDNERASIVGAPTFGKGSVQTIFQLPEGAGLRLTTMRYYTPAGRAIQVAGIEPDVIIEYEQDPNAPLGVLREDSLQGHLSAERRRRAEHKVTVLKGGKRPEYVPVDKVPTNPAKGKDFALAVGYRMLIEHLHHDS